MGEKGSGKQTPIISFLSLSLVAFFWAVFPSSVAANGDGGEADVLFHAIMSVPLGVWLLLGLLFLVLLAGIIFLQGKK